jgi:chaperonin GroEL (HSP60 family)
VPLELTQVINFIYLFTFFQGGITNILEENVVQPLLVSTSAITLASETVRSILKIDDIVSYVGDIMFRGGCFCL